VFIVVWTVFCGYVLVNVIVDDSAPSEDELVVDGMCLIRMQQIVDPGVAAGMCIVPTEESGK
jgi:hypothetical protein